MKPLRSIILTFCLFLALNSEAQHTGAPNGFSAKALLLNHYSLNESDNKRFKNYTSGLELGYHRALTNSLSFAIPLKFAVIQLPEDANKKVFSAVDFTLRLQNYKANNFITPFIYGGGGVVNEDLETTSIQFPLGAGVNIKLSPREFLVISGEYRKSLAENRDNFNFGIGVMMIIGKDAPKANDRDNDGVSDDTDLCPDKPGLMAFKGCPDRDNDGIPDKDDNCPDIAGVVSQKGCPETKDTDGDGILDDKDDCPEQPGNSINRGCPDKDGDGIVDKFDKCPEVAGTKEKDGCPASSDSDGDGVDDSIDKCPTYPGSKATNGCPDSDGDGFPDNEDECPTLKGIALFKGCPDSDGDGISDRTDRCPYAAGPASSGGCPEVKEAVQEILKRATQAVQFQSGTATLESKSYKILNEVVAIMKENPNYNIEIGGHTDNIGTAQKNMLVSESRAKACYEYIVAQGIEPNRLTYKGFGKTKPIATNNTVEGRQQNRRTEFNVFFK